MLAGGPATILVLEDNAAVQELIEHLRDSGHRILSTQNALEALAVVRRVRIDVPGESHTELEVVTSRRDGGGIRVAVNSVPLRNGNGVLVGSFGLVHVLEELELSSAAAPSLSPREHQTLTLLAAGLSTAQMAEQMGISKETVRNHVKGLLRGLGARSRVEAVARARRAGLI